jgi:hypothetical protein
VVTTVEEFHVDFPNVCHVFQVLSGGEFKSWC